MASVEPSGVRWRQAVAAVLERDGYSCCVPRGGVVCARPAVTADHVVPPAAGGPVYDPDNLRAACLDCNPHTRGRGLRRPDADVLTRRQAAIVYALDVAGVAADAGRRVVARALARPYDREDIDAACAWRREHGARA